MRYLLIDKIKSIECNKKITAIKNVALSEDVFFDHFAGYPVMPGALQIEAVAQAATALLEVSSDFKLKALLTIVDKAKFRKLVKPGDQLLINVNIISMQEKSALLEGVITSDGKTVMDGKFVFNLKNADVFYPLKTRVFIESVYDSGLKMLSL
ncbi:MAG: beta-hydroxyacyl-ACP dehydratase [Ignavibacteria bacterium]|nr:beta-hydroxyacyl-ACP dehydratase [Ignavibacteria bacterium]